MSSKMVLPLDLYPVEESIYLVDKSNSNTIFSSCSV